MKFKDYYLLKGRVSQAKELSTTIKVILLSGTVVLMILTLLIMLFLHCPNCTSDNSQNKGRVIVEDIIGF